MKIKIDREHISIAQKEEAANMAKTESWIDAETLKTYAARILKAHHNTEHVYVENLLAAGELKVTVNHWQLTVWADAVTVAYSVGSDPKIAILSFDVLRECREEFPPESFTQVYDRVYCGTR